VAKDPYTVLGVSRDASEDEIRKAYRKLAKENHPDLKPGDQAAEKRFLDAQAANDIVGNKDKRARFDRGEIDADGHERVEQPSYRHYAEAGADHPYNSADGYADMGGMFSDLFGQRRSGGQKVRMRGGDVRYTFEVDFLDAARGTKSRITMPDAKALDLAIPAGMRDGQVLRLKGKGSPGLGGGPAGDALVTVHVKPHSLFRRQGNDIHIDLPVTLQEAVLGAKVRVPTIDGLVSMNIPKGSNTGARLRLKGKGVPAGKSGRGDQHVTLKVMLPDDPDPELVKFLEEWSQEHGYDPRLDIEA
tara:strand:+ start:82740 stop:83645 length:906 start_codon:yes stop_codon:yes gene_type:complete